MIDSIQALRAQLFEGHVIPAHPLALDAARVFDERHQRALTRYYLDAGAGGIAIGVHTTQFAVHRPDVGLYKTLLRVTAEEIDSFERRRGATIVRVAGVIGTTGQAVWEAGKAVENGYHAALLGLGALARADDRALLEHCARVSAVLPLFGFYLQPAAGGRVLSYDFWRRFCEIDNVVAIKIAPFNRYQTLDVVRAVADAGRVSDIALYTGNDDAIVADLLTDFDIGGTRLRFAGGLLGQWAVWTRRAVELLDAVKRCRAEGGRGAVELLTLGAQLTDANAAVFDAAHGFAGCIPGIHAVLAAQGLLASECCLDSFEVLSPGQRDEIMRVTAAYPHLCDDMWVSANKKTWFSDEM